MSENGVGAGARAGGERVVAASTAADDCRIIHYVLDGRAGNMPIPPDGALHANEMKENLAPSLTPTPRARKRGALTPT